MEIIILEQPVSPPQQTEYPLQGKQPYRYDDPFEPAVPVEDWEAISAIMTEWNSEADELAYRNP